jgi:hypothetical protein
MICCKDTIGLMNEVKKKSTYGFKNIQRRDKTSGSMRLHKYIHTERCYFRGYCFDVCDFVNDCFHEVLVAFNTIRIWYRHGET